MDSCIGNYSFKIDENVPILLKLKLPKLVVGPLELSSNFSYDATANAPRGLEANGPIHLLSKDRLSTSVSVKDIWFRGKIEIIPEERKLRYSKKIRFPWTQSTICTLSATALFPEMEARSSLKNVLGVNFDFKLDVPKESLTFGTDCYVLPFSSQVSIPKCIFPAKNVSIKAKGQVAIEDPGSLWDIRTSAQVREISAVVRLYDRSKLKPCMAARRIALLAFGPVATHDDVTTAITTASVFALKPISAPLTSPPHPPIPLVVPPSTVCKDIKDEKLSSALSVTVPDAPSTSSTASPHTSAPSTTLPKKVSESSLYELVPVTREPDVWDHMASRGRILSHQIYTESKAAKKQMCSAIKVAQKEACRCAAQAKKAGEKTSADCRTMVEELHLSETAATAWNHANIVGRDAAQKVYMQVEELFNKSKLVVQRK
mmetsp:Transcript_34273/g.61836  ORF Transcript_34273/g.61836 Transcript_34273/m.61836 type:complete len:430 (-) Transcript_34273:911-2200(-)|eukprot:CAMPEP_0175079798 /NCGR_PEP_ID=MMETSP0052_2-20121109/25059_1 /TAXON_ID=51329 ORGANISM="Polytomella parva, Strain SAG 63-3" /NCGR_SAMPLE_ID=MMETSP0052_2 /ASSEMBLY_ACC=CAM_ASM_000194 /LENGTH=429 /DNA_ID=CAMNT_0016350241 /DNA_START=95 /DNA_END=1384 /DNA_ORIENTATION=-